MPCVTECDDSWLSDVLAAAARPTRTCGPRSTPRPTAPSRKDASAPGTGMQCFDFKGGIGTASRVLPTAEGGYTVGVLVMTNHGDREVLLIDGLAWASRSPT